jgi:hypothetical protein
MSFVDDLNGLRAKCRLVATPVMTAEQQIRATRQDDSNVGLGVAAIAAVCRAQHGGGHRGRHVRGTSSGFIQQVRPTGMSCVWYVQQSPTTLLFRMRHAAWFTLSERVLTE